MLTIAVLAVLFAAFGMITAVAIFMVVILLPIPLAAPGCRLRTMVWVGSIYPFLILSSFYTSWLAAWCALGHAPRAYFDDPDRLHPIVNAVRAVVLLLTVAGAPVIWFVYAPLILAIAYWNMAQRTIPVGKGVTQPFLPLFAWLSAYAIFQWDPVHAWRWFID
jgi:hypothetical protein